MLIDPDFFDHWRTRMLVDLLNDECAPIYLMRLWAHCQLRKADRFKLPASALKAICRYQGDADEFERAMIESGWAEREGDEIIATGWAERNAKLVKAWENGGKGGRPKTQRKPKRNPTETHEEPTDNPTGTQTQVGLTHEKPIGLDKTGEDKEKENAARSCLDGETPPQHTTPRSADKKAPPVTWDAEQGFSACSFRRLNWAKAYPLVDLDHELAKAHAWYLDNPARRKRSHTRFLGNWLSNAQERAEQDAKAGAPPSSLKSHAKRSDSYNHTEDTSWLTEGSKSA